MQKPNKQPAKPQLQQQEREAIIDLLHLCLYADANIAANEGEFLSQVVEDIGWEAKSSFSSYEPRSIASARAVRADTEARKEFLSAAARRLKSPASRALAIDLCKRLFSSDDSTVAKEADMLFEIRGALK